MSRNSTRLDDLDRWLELFLAVVGRKTRRTWAPLYLRGLLGPGQRKSLLPMAERLGLSGHDQLQHFVASPAWDDAPLWDTLAQEADRLLGGQDAFLVICRAPKSKGQIALDELDRVQAAGTSSSRASSALGTSKAGRGLACTGTR